MGNNNLQGLNQRKKGGKKKKRQSRQQQWAAGMDSNDLRNAEGSFSELWKGQAGMLL